MWGECGANGEDMGEKEECEKKMRYIDIGKPYEKQRKFFEAESRFVAYGGARGGGKSWAARVKAMLLAVNYPGIQILFLRRHLHELRENHIMPMMKLVHGCASYKASTREFLFENSSRIVMGYLANETDVLQYQGQSYDVIFMEEATQFTEFQFQTLTECNRSSGLCKKVFYPRMYFTCNPGGVGHEWVKRLFVDKIYRNNEKEEDYTFIRSGVYDNPFLLENSPDYVRNLENLPKNRREAMLYGNWDIYDGQYFAEFSRDTHVCFPFDVSGGEYKKYISIDYGLDMFAALWIAVDVRGRAYVYREVYEKNVIISQAAEIMKKMSEGETISMRFAPPDLFSRRQETGKSAVDIFREHGLVFYKTDNTRVGGWYELKEWLKLQREPDGKMRPRLMIFENCRNLIRTLPALQFDTKNPNDVSSAPHELTHAPDALRGFVMSQASKKAVESRRNFNLENKARYEGFLEYGM